MRLGLAQIPTLVWEFTGLEFLAASNTGAVCPARARRRRQSSSSLTDDDNVW